MSGDQQHEVAGQQRALGGGAGDVILGFHCAIHSEPFSGSPANVIMPFAATVMSSSSKIGTPIASSMVAKQRMRCSISGRVAG